MKPDLFVFEACTDIAKFFINSKAFLFFVLAITDFGYEDGETSHT